MDFRQWSTRPAHARGALLPSREPSERYQVHGTLGRGGVAVVYAATDLATGQKVALKRTLPPDWFETFEDALRACRELGRPARDAFTLRSRLAGLISAFSVPDRGNSAALFAQLAREGARGEPVDRRAWPSIFAAPLVSRIEWHVGRHRGSAAPAG